MARSVSSGTKTSDSKPQVLNGTRRRIYQHDEHLVMVNMDRFDRLESIVENRSRFSHIAAVLLSASVPLGIEMGMQARHDGDPVAIGVFVTCLGAFFIGLLFAYLSWVEASKYKSARNSLFSDDKLLDDESITYYQDGSTSRVKNPIISSIP